MGIVLQSWACRGQRFPWLRTTLPTVFAPSVFPGAVHHILLTLVSLLQGPVLNSCGPREGKA